MRVRSVVFDEHRSRLTVESVELLEPGVNDVVVRVAATATCHTDLAVARGHKAYGSPVLCGHEACGVVEWAGDAVGRVAVGDRVVAVSAPSCGRCWSCQHGHPNVCASSATVRDTPRARRTDGSLAPGLFGLGTFSEAMTVDEASLVRVDTDLPDDQLALIGCGVTTGLGAVIVKADLRPGDSITVVGCGTVGLAAIQGARIAGASEIIGVDPLPDRRALAERFGATVTFDPSSSTTSEAIAELTGGRGTDVAVDAVGRSETFLTAFRSARRAGRVLMVGMPEPEALPVDAWELFLSEKVVSSSLFGSVHIRRDIPRFVSMVERGSIDLASMVTNRLGLDDVNDALDSLERGEGLRSVLVP